jgi:hypothetical protein
MVAVSAWILTHIVNIMLFTPIFGRRPFFCGVGALVKRRCLALIFLAAEIDADVRLRWINLLSIN